MAEGIVIGNLTIPVIKGDKGDKGNAGEIVSISLVLLSPSSTAYAINNGSTTQAQIELGIPKGLSVSTTNINASGELVFTFNDNSTVNVGKVVGKGISEVAITEEYDFVVTYTDGTSATVGNLETEILEAINTILEDYYTKTEIDEMGFITKEVDNLTNYTLKTNTGSSIELSINNSTYVMTLNLKNSAGTTISTGTIDLPLETMVVGATYDNTNKKIVLTLKNGSTIDVPVADLVSGLQSEITNANKLSADLVDDTSTTHKFTSTSEKNSWNAKYNKPSGGIPKTDLASDVQTSLGKADTAVQDVSEKEDKTNKTSTIDENSTNTQYPNAKAVYDELVLRDEKISDLKTKNELLVKDHVPIENTGAELQLTGTGDLPMELFPYGNISQETREGYNEIDITDKYGTTSTISGIEFKFNNDGTIILDGTSTSAINFIVETITLQPNNYYVSGCPSTGGTGTYFTQLVNSTNGYYIFNNSYETGNGIAFNLTAETSCNYRIHIENGIKLNKIIWKPLLCKSTTAKPYEAYGAAPSTEFESPAKVVDGEYDLLAENKNLANKNNVINAFIDTSNNTLYGLVSTRTIYRKCKPNTTYKISKIQSKRFIAMSAENYVINTIGSQYVQNNNGTSITYTTGKNDKYLLVFFYNSNYDTLTVQEILDSIQIEEGTVETEYIAHAEQTVSIDTSSNPLYSENDCYKYLTSEQTTALELNTGAGWYCYNEYANQNFASGVSSVTIDAMKSDGIFYSTVGGTVSGTTITFDGTTTGTGNIIYELATPTYTKITNANLIASLEALKDMQSYYDITNISQTHSDGQADMNIQANALKSLKAMQSETDTLLNAKVDKSSFVYDSNTETLSITIS